jgi:hypothetical protein
MKESHSLAMLCPQAPSRLHDRMLWLRRETVYKLFGPISPSLPSLPFLLQPPLVSLPVYHFTAVLIFSFLYSSFLCSFVQAAGRPSSPSLYVNFNRNFVLSLSRHVRFWFCDTHFRGSFCCERRGISSAGAAQGALLSIQALYGYADGFVSVPWLNAVRRRLNPYKLMSTVTLFVCVASNCITITEHPSQHVDRGTVPDGSLMYEKRDSNINTIPEELPTKAPTGLLEAYVKRQGNINTIPEELPTKAPTGLLEAYVKRDSNINTIPEELPTKAPTGLLEAYVKRQGNINTIPEELPTKAPTGLLEAYVKRDSNINTIPEELPTKAPEGSLEAY